MKSVNITQLNKEKKELIKRYEKLKKEMHVICEQMNKRNKKRIEELNQKNKEIRNGQNKYKISSNISRALLHIEIDKCSIITPKCYCDEIYRTFRILIVTTDLTEDGIHVEEYLFKAEEDYHSIENPDIYNGIEHCIYKLELKKGPLFSENGDRHEKESDYTELRNMLDKQIYIKGYGSFSRIPQIKNNIVINICSITE